MSSYSYEQNLGRAQWRIDLMDSFLNFGKPNDINSLPYPLQDLSIWCIEGLRLFIDGNRKLFRQ